MPTLSLYIFSIFIKFSFYNFSVICKQKYFNFVFTHSLQNKIFCYTKKSISLNKKHLKFSNCLCTQNATLTRLVRVAFFFYIPSLQRAYRRTSLLRSYQNHDHVQNNTHEVVSLFEDFCFGDYQLYPMPLEFFSCEILYL